MYFPEKGNVDDDATLIDYDIFGFIEFTVLLPHAVCSLRSVVCSLQSAVCGLQSVVCKCHTPNSQNVRKTTIVAIYQETSDHKLFDFVA